LGDHNVVSRKLQRPNVIYFVGEKTKALVFGIQKKTNCWGVAKGKRSPRQK